MPKMTATEMLRGKRTIKNRTVDGGPWPLPLPVHLTHYMIIKCTVTRN